MGRVTASQCTAKARLVQPFFYKGDTKGETWGETKLPKSNSLFLTLKSREELLC